MRTFCTDWCVKGLKHITAMAGTTTVVERAATAAPASAAAGAAVERAATTAPAPAPAVAAESSLPADPITAASPTTGGMVAQQSAEENNQEGTTGKGRTAQAPDGESDSVPGEKETATREQEREEAVTMNEPAPAHDLNNKPKAGGDLLLELIRSFRGGMLRVDSNLRAAMFRSLRYLVGSKRVFPRIIATDEILLFQPRQNYELIARK